MDCSWESIVQRQRAYFGRRPEQACGMENKPGTNSTVQVGHLPQLNQYEDHQNFWCLALDRLSAHATWKKPREGPIGHTAEAFAWDPMAAQRLDS